MAGPGTIVGVIGAGSWGTALAIHTARHGLETLIWARDSATVESINGPDRENKQYLPGFKVPDKLTATGDLSEVIARAHVILMVVPTPFIADVMAPVAHLLRDDCILVSCSKGILNDTLEMVHEILMRVTPARFHPNLAYLSGPSFAAEVAKGLPTMVTIAAADDSVAARVQALLSSPTFRCYRTTDIVGVEAGGALKNVLAIACGISDGLEFGANARAGLITRGLSEITRLAVAKGGHPLTMGGLAGMGDLVLTCTGDLSRNRQVGLRIGRGETLADIKSSMHGAVAEGVLTSRSAAALAKKLGVECPIIDGIYQVIHEGANPKAVVADRMARDLKPEVDDDLHRSIINASSNAATVQPSA